MMTRTPGRPAVPRPIGGALSRRAAVAILTVGVVALTGCSEDLSNTPDEPHDLAPSRPPVDEPLVTVNTYPAVVNPSVVETSPSARTVAVGETGRRVHLAYPQLGFAALDQHVATNAEQSLATFDAAESPDELNATWGIVGSGEDVVGVLSETYSVLGGAVQNTWTTSWYDAGAGVVVPNTALVESPEVFAEEITNALDGQLSVDPDALAATLVDGAPVMAFTENGELFVGFDEFEIAPSNTGRVNVVLTLDQTDELLSDFGDRAQESLVSPDELPLPPGTHEAPASPEETPEASGEASSEEPAAVDCTTTACVALAFDGGPSESTPDLLDALDAADARATFFVLGQQVAAYPEATAQVAQRGHEIGVHTWSHRDLTRLTLPELDGEITRTVQAIADAAGAEATMLRVPYGATNGAVTQRATNAGLRLVPAPASDVDASTGTTEEIAAQALAEAAAGSVVTLPVGTPQSVEAVGVVVEQLRAQGLQVVTVSELLGDSAGPDGPDAAPDGTEGSPDPEG